MDPVVCTAKPDGIAYYSESGRRTFTPFREPLQLYRKKFKNKVVDYEKDRYTPLQNREYRIAIYGLGAFPPDELRKMHPSQLKKARWVFKKAQVEINRMKNEVMEDIMRRTFCNSHIFKESFRDVYDDVHNSLSFSELGITKQEVITRLVSRKILRAEVFKL